MKLRVSNHKTAALTRVEVVVVILVVAVLILFLLKKSESDFRAARLYTANIYCINNLKQVGLAFNSWANEHAQKYPTEVSTVEGGAMEMAKDGNATAIFEVMTNELVSPKILICPADTGKNLATNFNAGLTAKNISYFVGLDAKTNYCPQTCAFLSGDDNFAIGNVPVGSGLLAFSSNAPITWTDTRHRLNGRIVFSDGSVLCSSANHERLPDLIHQTGFVTNHLAIP